NSVVDDRYFVERSLGRGSYAEIFLAYDHAADDAPVIIKSLNTSLQGTPDPELEQTLIENFQNEAIALDRVRHPHIIQRLGHGTAADLQGVPFHYLVLEYMPGGDLWSLCRSRRLSFDDSVSWFQQVAEALAYAHSQRVIHRDIKPNNILLSANHRILKIADFGVAKMTLDDVSEITRVGTNVYAPPEHHPDVRADDLNEKLTPSADVYSLAKTIYTAMTGRAPRQFSRLPITELPGDLQSEVWSGSLLSVLSKATASRVADRYQTVEEFWQSFTQVRTADADDEATVVRSRLSSGSSVEQVAAQPNFQTLSHQPREVAQKARIVVDLPSHSGSREPERIEDGGTHADNVAGQHNNADAYTTRSFGSPGYAVDPQVQTVDNNGWSATASAEKNQVEVRKPASPPAVRPKRRAMTVARAFITSDWLPRVFIIFLAAALIGLLASTYYHFAGLKPGSPIFGVSAKEGRIANAPNVNLRSDPFGAVLIALPEKTRVRVLEERNGWLRVKVLDWAGSAPDNAPDQGWVDGRFVKID
ncbi:MAG TPA: serine/threonine protein kinase, partial [Blastocatellia bacterium]|nr:serine/threonine protein kinase [Blastocatellia bacterium]